ncbi:MAG: hypothetical protein F9K18_01870 [Thermoanaerobaculia bacterium]|nr:MAG: hypothetical protein F9K18_01870 [Thermoanaerobaculia bacterium]
MLERLFADPTYWKLASIPLSAAVIGWLTNWIAIRMTFHPIRFLGIPPWLGWQGIIPRKAEKMARIFVDSSMKRLGSVPELFAEMEPEAIARHIERVLEPRLRHYTDDVIIASKGEIWERAPRDLRERVYGAVARELPRLVRVVLADFGAHLESLLDFRHMVVRRLVEDRSLLNRLFLESGAREFRFLIDSGFWFGLLFGLVQLGTWVLAPGRWQLPVYGLVVGWATNWLALNLVFRPLQPVRVGPWAIQGLFLRRQKEVAAVWCRIVTREILTVRRFMASMITGPHAERARATIFRHLGPVVDEAVAAAGPLARSAIAPGDLERITRTFERKALEVTADPLEDERFNDERAAVVERLLRERIEEMPPEEFQELLRPCFKEDEWILIALGAALGALAGLGQILFVFG